MKKCSINLLLVILFFIPNLLVAQTITSSGGGTGAWNDANSWSPAVVPTSINSSSIIINHAITLTVGITIDQVTINTGNLIINNGVTLTLGSASGDEITVNSTGTLTVNGSINYGGSFPLRTILVNGTMNNTGTHTSVTSSKLTFGNGSNYIHAFADGGTIPSATWNAGSTMSITGIGSGAVTLPSGLNQTFGNFVWNTPSFDGFFDLLGNPSSIAGDFRIEDTGSGSFVYNFGGGSNVSFSVGGDFEISGGQFAFIAFVGSSATLNINTSLTPGKGLKVTGGYFQVADDDNVTVTCNGLVNIATDMELAATSASTALNLTGDFTHTAGSLFSTSGTNTITFTGTSAQTYTSTLTPNGNLNYNVATNAILSIPGSNFIGGGGTFTLSSNGTLQLGSTDSQGALRTGSIGGNIRTTGRTYNTPSTIVYNGVAAQFIGNGHPTITGINTTVNNSSGVSLIVGVPAIITTNLTLASGNLNIGNGSLTLNGTLTPGSNNITVGSTGSLIINGSASLGTFPFPSGAQTFSNFTLNNNNGISFGNDVTLTGNLTLSDGPLVINNRILTLQGSLTSGSGSLSTNSSSTLIIDISSSWTSNLSFTSGANTIGTLTKRRSGTAGINNVVTVSGSLNLEGGVLDNAGSGIAMGSGSTLTRSGGSLGTDRPDVPAGSYNVIYNPGSSTNTGFELPTIASHLNNLTISGPTVLTQNITVNGNVTLASGTFTCGSNTITMQGSTWSRSGGSFVPGTGQVTFNGNTSITATSGTPQLGNIRVENTRTLTFYSGTTAVSGNITFISGSTVNANGGTLLLNGSGLQTFGGGGKSLNNITVTKTGGSIDLTSALSITGLLNITTAHAFASNGNLTLVSSSDGTSGNASIADLSAGGSVTGNVIVQRFVSGEGRVWRYLSSPISNASVASWKDNFPITGSFSDPSTPAEWPTITPLTSSSISMYRYNETTVGTRDLGWEAFPTSGLASANPIEVGRGYSAFVRITPASTVIDVTGPINSGTIALPVTLTGTGGVNNDNGWNLVGNPYPSTIDWDSPNWTKTNISGVVQIRDDPSGIFQTWNGSVGSMGSGRIATGQGFWVQAVGAPTLTARESVKVNTTGTFYKQNNQVPNAFELIVSKGTEKDYAYLWFKEDATEAIDAAYDAPKFNNDIFDFSILTADNTPLAINTIPFINCGAELKLNISTANTQYDIKGTYQLEFNELGSIDPSIKLKLIDTFASTETEVSDGGSYSFEINEDLNSFGSNRFKLLKYSGVAPFEVTNALGASNCKSGSVTLTAEGAPGNGIYKWYDSESAETTIAESVLGEFTTPVLDKSKTYYVSIANDLGCESARATVTADIINYDDVFIDAVDNKLISSYSSGNQWFKDDVLLSGATDQEYIPSESGTYKVEVSVESCKTSAERSFTVTGLEDDELFDKLVSVYPNPVNTILTIKILDQITGPVRILSLEGRSIGNVELTKAGKYWEGNFDFRGKAEGLYLLQISDKNGKILNKRIVKK